MVLLSNLQRRVSRLLISLATFRAILTGIRARLHSGRHICAHRAKNLAIGNVLLCSRGRVSTTCAGAITSRRTALYRALSRRILRRLHLHLFSLCAFSTLGAGSLCRQLLNRSVRMFHHHDRLSVSATHGFLRRCPAIRVRRTRVGAAFRGSRTFLHLDRRRGGLN